MKDYILDEIINTVNFCKSKQIGYTELLRELKNYCFEIAEKHQICYKCCEYLAIRYWEEHHLFGETTAAERMSAYYCPRCGEEL